MNTKRRDFIKHSAVIAAGVAVMPTILNAGCSPNEKITVGLIGAWVKQKNGVYELNDEFYKTSSGIFDPITHYEGMFEKR